MQERFIAAKDNITWHIYEDGKETAPTIFLIAGFPQSAYAWRKVWPLLAKQYHVLAIDLPGQGYSSVPRSGYDTKTTAHRIHELVIQLGLKKILYVGHDVGSWVGFTYAHLFPDDLLGITLIDANIPGVTLQKQIPLDAESWRSWHFLFNVIPDLPEELLKGKERVLLEWFFSNKARNWRTAFTKEDIAEYVQEYRQLGVMRGMLGYYRAVLDDFKINEPLCTKKIVIPLLTINGEFGSSRDLFEKLKTLGKSVNGRTIKESGHYIPEEKPADLAAQILEFIKSLV
ncbi:alpha/beta fold hydrolase [Liquorilactobacillus satsumensis]|uniref:alpha/beta fold hydrolase n=2 Tax=Lactobacillaceae TaxID=33958 RepID=UPI001E4D044B|nr:alpha/beta hydrolase [Liquorilactobacillus satsumensis]MCC7667693.1 hydrolase [Liquorilactobacillus satsumensis]MCP9313874.1 alpha/beta hydrolase [Liquorilactobacillus satsumensis]MCP9357145.1 alpha/beta hydrolase [Liquorilactobacillus satsumensis]MCP9361015.1 alpha/beta hydrolase [Liquorilactobacillus satsumensis]MCP9371092.1 alpha/beta hydrolase [Liquorilactobacillus satsumensis]